MNPYMIGAAARWIWGILTMPIGGGAKREQEKNEMLEELKLQREQYHTLMTNHIAHLDANMAGHTEALSKIVEVQTAQLKALDLLAQEHRQHSLDHQEMRERFARMEGRLDL